MEIKAVIHEKYEEVELHVCNHEMNDEVRQMMTTLNELVGKKYVVRNERGDSELIDEKDVVMIYAENEKVFIRTANGNYETKSKLYEIEKELPTERFFRISRSEIVNINKIARLDMSLTGTIRISLKDGSESYVSRRNVTKLKSVLGI